MAHISFMDKVKQAFNKRSVTNMTIEDLFAQATVYQELESIKRTKAQRKQEKQLEINRLQTQIDELKEQQKQQSYSLLNPTRFTGTSDTVTLQTEIEQLQQAISAHQNAILEIERLNPIELVDLSELKQQSNSIVQEQQIELDNMMAEILKVQKKYFELMNIYGALFETVDSFANTVTRKVESYEKQRNDRDEREGNYNKNVSEPSFKPLYFSVKTPTVDGRMLLGHVRDAVNFHSRVKRYEIYKQYPEWEKK